MGSMPFTTREWVVVGMHLTFFLQLSAKSIFLMLTPQKVLEYSTCQVCNLFVQGRFAVSNPIVFASKWSTGFSLAKGKLVM